MKSNRFLLRNAKTLALILLLSTTAISSAQELLGAREVIRRQNAHRAKPDAANRDLENFKNDLPKLTPQEAGKRWAEIMMGLNNQQNASTEEVMSVLPPTASWATIASEFESKSPKNELKLIGSMLVGDKAKQSKYLAAMLASKMTSPTVWKIALSLATGWQDEAMTTKSLANIVSLTNAQLTKLSATPNSREGRPEYLAIDIPDLASAFGKEKAKAMMLTVLKSAKVPLRINGRAGKILVASLCRQYGSTFPREHCELVQSVESADLYPLFNQWFPKSTGTAKVSARAFYVLSKVITGNGDAFLQDGKTLERLTEYSNDINYEARQGTLQLFGKPEIAKLSWGYLDKVLRANPSLKLWNFYAAASFASGKSHEMVPVLRMGLAVPTKGDAGNGEKATIAPFLVKAVALEGTPDDVAKVVLQNLKADYGDGEDAIKLGRILGRADLVKAGYENIMKIGSSAVPYLIQDGRYAEAEALLTKLDPQEMMYGNEMSFLVDIYAKLGRNKDIIDLLDFSPYWNATDLKDVGRASVGYREEASKEAFFEVAQAFLNSGMKDVGVRTLLLALSRDTKNDDIYAVLVKTLDSDTAIKELDRMFKQDMFEERPLIWKAIILQRAGKLDEAEKVARQAISIDPSDGDMGHGKRMLGYKVLSEILATKGNDKDSKMYQSVVDAIRLSEKADDYLAAGLMKQAIGMYSDSLKIFADAYCIQSRMAVNLANEGKTAEAIDHFKRAFELMPNSFGRVETHCFGCEGVFTTGPAEGIAETVLQDAAKKNPTKPQSQYLLGYLRKEQERYAEAAQYFKKAVELDPDYLNAWKEYALMSEEGGVSVAESERILLNLVRLDPMEQHGSFSDSALRVKNFAKVYDALSAAKSPYENDGTLYVLQASKSAMEADESRQRTMNMFTTMRHKTPGSKIAAIDPIQQLLQLVLYGDAMDGGPLGDR